MKDIVIPVEDLAVMLTTAAQMGRDCAPTAGDYTDQGIAYHVLMEWLSGQDLTF